MLLLVFALGAGALTLLGFAPDLAPLVALGVARPEGLPWILRLEAWAFEGLALLVLFLLLWGRTRTWWLDGLVAGLSAWTFRGPLLVLAVAGLTRLPVAPFWQFARGALVVDVAAALALAVLARRTIGVDVGERRDELARRPTRLPDRCRPRRRHKPRPSRESPPSAPPSPATTTTRRLSSPRCAATGSSATSTSTGSSSCTGTSWSAAATWPCRSRSTRRSPPSASRTAPGSGSPKRSAARPVLAALTACGLTVADIDALFFVTVTGVATPSIDARLINRLGLRPDLKRVPIFGLGCVAGAAGIARAADYVRGFPDQVAVLLSVELCSLTLQRQDLSIPNLIASGLFGDGAAAAVVVGAERATRRSDRRSSPRARSSTRTPSASWAGTSPRAASRSCSPPTYRR